MFLLLEAALTFVFWLVMSKNGGGDFYSFGIRSLCPWNVHELPYTGLCSHNPLLERMFGDFALSPQDLEDLEKTRKRNEAARKPPRNQQNVAKNKRKKKFYCAVCNYSAAHQRNLDVHLASERHLKQIAGQASTKGTKRKDRASTIAKKKYYCAPCDYSAVHKQNLDVHLKSQKHLKKVLRSSSGSSS